MLDNYINVVFVLDESGSMFESRHDVVGGFNKTIEEQKAIKEGKCTISLFKFANSAKKIFVGKNLDEIQPLKTDTNDFLTAVSSSLTINGLEQSSKDVFTYSPGGMTAMNDGIGLAIDEVGKWLAAMPEEERPSKNLIVIMTDGEENYSNEYTLSRVQEMIKHQTEKYNWTFVYMGTDITTKEAADNLGITTRSFSSRSMHDTYCNYSNISNSVKAYRTSDVLCASANLTDALEASLGAMTESYEKSLNIKIED